MAAVALADRAVRLWGRERAGAHAYRVCVRCSRPVDAAALADLDLREYVLTALCPSCFDVITSEEPWRDVVAGRRGR